MGKTTAGGVIAVWEPTTGGPQVILRSVPIGTHSIVYAYTAAGASGSLGEITVGQAISEMQRRINQGHFGPGLVPGRQADHA